MQQEVDYVIVGAGSAGCVLANRLSADPSNVVMLLEAGGPDTSPWIHIPVGYFKTMHDPELDWCYRTEAGRCRRRTQHRLAARQGARRLQLDQRAALCARPARGLRPLGRARQRRLEL